MSNNVDKTEYIDEITVKTKENRGARYLAKNVSLLMISQFSTKLIGFILVPLYTNILTTAEYGTFDIFSSTIALMVPILTLNICDSAQRFLLDEKEDRKEIVSVINLYLGLGVLIAGLLLVANHFLGIFPLVDEHVWYIFAMFVAAATLGISTNLARGVEAVKSVAIGGMVGTVITLALNIILLVPMKMGLEGYFIAMIAGSFSQTIFLLISIKYWKYITFKRINISLQARMLAFSCPMIINSVSWWINNVSDRYVVTWFCGIDVNGIYSVSYKIPSILVMFQNIFNQAWFISAVKDYDKEDSLGFFSKLYNSYNGLMTVVCSVLILLSKVIARIFFGPDYFDAWKYVPFLLISVVFGALSGYIGGIFIAVKKSKITAYSTLFSAFVNIVLNIVLVLHFGAIGAAVSTAVCYLTVWMIRLFAVKKYIKLRLKLVRDTISYILLVFQAILLFFMKQNILYFGVQLGALLVIVVLYSDCIIDNIAKVKNKLKTGKQ